MSENVLTEKLIDEILHKLPGQVFAVKRIIKEWTENERERLEQELQYLTSRYSMEEIANGYFFVTNNFMEEAKYFKEHGDYRYHSFAEVNNYIYADPENMKLYMLGLSVAEFFWSTLLRIHRFYEKIIRNFSGEGYLEIGPGHGKYFLEAYNLQSFQWYDAVDVSETAIEMTRDYVERYKVNGRSEYHLFCEDATKLPANIKYDFIVIQEVLEHIEEPLDMLKSIHEMLTPRGRVYALIPINTPSPAHIFLFHSIEHVMEIVTSAGFKILQKEYITANNISLDQAEEKKQPINACLVLGK